MSFPSTGILDNFNRGNESPVDGNWSPFYGDLKAQLVSNAIIHLDTSDGSSMYWNPNTYQDSENYYTITTKGTTDFSIFTRMGGDPINALDGYRGYHSIPLSLVRIQRLDDSVKTTLGADITSVTFANGDGFGFEMIGSTITTYKRISGSWAGIGNRSDATYASGYIGLRGGDDTTWVFDDFGGGTVVVSIPVAILKSGKSFEHMLVR